MDFTFVKISSHLTRTYLEVSYRPVISHYTEIHCARYLSSVKISSCHKHQTKAVKAEIMISKPWSAASHNQVTEMLHLKTIEVWLKCWFAGVQDTVSTRNQAQVPFVHGSGRVVRATSVSKAAAQFSKYKRKLIFCIWHQWE